METIQQVNLLILLLMAGSVLAGWHKGFVREFMNLLVWIPALGAMVMMIMAGLEPGKGFSDQNMTMMSLIGAALTMGLALIWLIDKFWIKPMFANRFRRSKVDWNKMGGAVFGLFRFTTTIIVGLFVFDVYVEPLPEEDLKTVPVMRPLTYVAFTARDWMADEGYISLERVQYDIEKRGEEYMYELREKVYPKTYFKLKHMQ